jgi:hypothetical protein
VLATSRLKILDLLLLSTSQNWDPSKSQSSPNMSKIASQWSESALVDKTGWVWLEQGWICVEDIITDHYGPFSVIKKSTLGPK